ncbi:peptidoglycan-binding protein [Tabrizicola sp.]|uniref:peptidoglycan-binding domain-containing protein n=1 Tax=Tabrizicola sp. TaxID=2005166 RepID=UPI00286D5491|nr:peptidoglycan-binding protein [Tabrizicola sp.]
MRSFTLPLILAASLGLTTPVAAQSDFEDLLGGLAQGLIQQELDRNAYIAAQEANTASAYRGYLAKFPKGKYRTNAEQALARLGVPVEGSTAAAAQAEARLGITYSQRIAVQRRLTRLGYNTYGADGTWGRNTRNAIATWQRDEGETATGYLTGAQLRALVGGVVVTPPDDETPPGNLSAAQVEASLGLTRTQRTNIQRQLTKIGYDAGVADGLWGSRTRAAISAWQRANRQSQTGYVTAAQVKLIGTQAGSVTPAPDDGNSAALEESLLGLSTNEKADLQRRLTRLGYNPLRTDGYFGPGTRRAIGEWQGDEGEPVTGYLTADQVRMIRVETGG